VYESSGKNPEGLFGSATLQAMGLFDECLDVKAQSFNDTTAGSCGCVYYLNYFKRL